MNIDSYAFGSITVNGKMYLNDVIVLPHKVRPEWWRKKSHLLAVEDLEEVIKYQPEILVVGRGASGVMNIPEETKKYLKEKNIELIEGYTEVACKRFNELIKQGKKVVGAFHLTC